MKIVLDNLIHDKLLTKIIVAFTHPGERLIEYPNDPDHAKWISRELLPLLEKEFPLLDAPLCRCLMGTSFGAVAALATAVRFPDTYGSLLLQSGSFLYSDRGVWHGEGRGFDPVVRFIDHYRAGPGTRLRAGVHLLRDVRRPRGSEPWHAADLSQHRNEDQLYRDA